MSGQAVLITGGSSGIGLGTVAWFAARGARVAAFYRDESKREAAATKLGAAAVHWLRVDLRDAAETSAMVERAAAELDGLDVVVNCASRTGSTALSPFLDLTSEHIDDIVDSNLKGTIRVSQAAARIMVRLGRGGSIVTVASVGAMAAQEHASVYCATKAAQVALTQTMAIELAPYGIRANCVSPGDIYTEASGTVVEDARAGGATGRFLRVTPLGRRGTVDEVAAAVGWLGSAEASFVTGANLVVDGGFLAY